MRNKRNILCFCDTYFQLLVAIRLRLTQFSDDNFYLIVSDASRNAKTVVEKLQNEKVFSQVFFAETRSSKKINLNNPMSVFCTALKCILDGHKSYNFAKHLPDIDIFLSYYISGYPARLLYSGLIKRNSNMVCSRFEEGLVSYFHVSCYKPKGKMEKVISFMMHHRGYKTLAENIQSFYCFFPDMYEGNLTPVLVEPIRMDDEKLISLIKRIFSVQPENLCYTQKYIYFASAVDRDFSIDAEFNIVQKVAEVVGKDNILIKKHPRDRRTVYEDNGYLVDQNSAIPWEAIQFCIDLSDKVLLSTFSGSVFSTNTMVDDEVKIFFLYPLCESKIPTVCNIKEGIEKNIEKLKRAGKIKKVKVIRNLKEI